MQDIDVYVGLDVHKDTITVAVAEAGRDGEVRSWGTIPHERTGIDRMLKKMTARHPGASYVYEAGPCGYGLYRHLAAKGAAPARTTQPGLLRGLADPRIASALRGLHGDIARPWTIPDLASEAGMSRSAFFERFTRLVGSRPIEYLTAWRMAVARDLLRRGGIALDDVAARVGYGSASTFSTAFSRHTGQPPGRFMRAVVEEG